jgi:hypothetical protein
VNRAARLTIVSMGVVVFAAAVATDDRWFDRHFLPSFYLPRHWYALIFFAVRWTMALAGVLLVVAARPVAARLTARSAARALSIAAAAVLAFGTSELILRRVHLRPAEWLWPDEEPRRQPDARLGWKLEPARAGRGTIGGRTIEYAIDAAGYRVRSLEEPVDPRRPAVLFAGESVMFGEGLTWDESVPAQTGDMLQTQAVNMAVHGFSTDQAYLRLEQELSRFRHPVAVVSLFMTALFGRNLDDDRPHLAPGLVWMPAVQHGRLVSLAGLIVPYRRDATVERGVAVTREVLRATAALARAHGAAPLVVVPQLGAEDPAERALRQRIFDGADVPYLLVTIDAAWRLQWDRHPNAAAARVIAGAIASRLHSVRSPGFTAARPLGAADR